MALTTYAELKTALASWLHRDDMTDIIPDLITMAEGQMNRELRVRQMVTVADSSSIAAGQETVTLPSNFNQAMALTVDGVELNQLAAYAYSRLKSNDPDATGTPSIFSLVGSALYVYPIPSEAMNAELTYFAKIPALSDANTTNWLLTAYPEAYLYGALVQGSRYRVDPSVRADDMASFQAILEQIKMSDARVRGGRLTMTLPMGRSDTFDITTGL
jgi:hypothetical protein